MTCLSLLIYGAPNLSKWWEYAVLLIALRARKNPLSHRKRVGHGPNFGPYLSRYCQKVHLGVNGISLFPFNHLSVFMFWETISPCKHKTLNRCWFDAGPASTTRVQHQAIIGLTSRVFCVLLLNLKNHNYCDKLQWFLQNHPSKVSQIGPIDYYQSSHKTLIQCHSKAAAPSTTLAQP